MEDESNKVESHMTSAAAFVEGGVQEACDDACSICLEAFCESDPATVTCCKHEFHLQCVLEWCQRSSNCPMCWQPISLKDPASQELLEAVEQERNFRSNPARNATIFHHPTLGDFELQHLPVGVNDAELEERIIQHLAAAAAMGRSHHMARRGSRSRSSAHGRPEFLVFSTHANAPSSSPVSGPLPPFGAEPEPRSLTVDNSSSPVRAIGSESQERMARFSSVQSNQISGSSSGSVLLSANRQGSSNSNSFRSSASQPSMSNHDQPGPSEFQSFSDSWKSRFNAMSMKYKESIAKSTKGWKERLFSRSSSMADIGSEVRREVNAGLASVSRMMERLESRDNNRAEHEVAPNNVAGTSVAEQRNHDEMEGCNETSMNNNNSSAFAASSVSS